MYIGLRAVHSLHRDAHIHVHVHVCTLNHGLACSTANQDTPQLVGSQSALVSYPGHVGGENARGSTPACASPRGTAWIRG